MSLADGTYLTRDKLATIKIDEVDDATLLHDKVILKLRNGETYTLPAARPEARQLYWTVKLRNRRKAFGL